MDTERHFGVTQRLQVPCGAVPAGAVAGPAEGLRRGIGRAEVLVAVLAFAALCVAVLTRTVQLLEPDDNAYRASIIALTRGRLSLTNTEYQELLKS